VAYDVGENREWNKQFDLSEKADWCQQGRPATRLLPQSSQHDDAKQEHGSRYEVAEEVIQGEWVLLH
jgi:Rieske Fe-S protein